MINHFNNLLKIILLFVLLFPAITWAQGNIARAPALSSKKIQNPVYTQKENNKSTAPNIIFIMADDLGYGDLQSYTPSSQIPTPNLNKLATEGMSFMNAHASASVCTPSRYSFLTGRYSWRSQRKKGVTWVWEGPMIHENTFTIGEMLQKKGYNTACIGKWHLGVDWPTRDGKPATLKNEGKNVDYEKPIQNGPTERGFNYYYGQLVPSFPPHAFFKNDQVIVKPTDWMPSGFAAIAGAMQPGWRYEDLMYSLTGKAIQYISDQATHSPEKPFFLYFSMSAAHTPIAPHENFQGKTKVGRYGDYVYEMDFHVGRILKVLDSLGISENTLVIFSSDNGGVNQDGLKYSSAIGALIKNYGHNSSGILKGMKSDAWEGGHRMPFIVRWPGHIKANSTSEALISQVDMMATFAALSGADIPREAGEDSYNLLPVFKNSSKKVRTDLVVQSGEGILSIQKGNWKLILGAGGGGKWNEVKGFTYLDSSAINPTWKNVQLYHISEDMRETSNVEAKYPGKVNELIQLLAKYINEGRSTPGKILSIAKPELWQEVKWVSQLQAAK